MMIGSTQSDGEKMTLTTLSNRYNIPRRTIRDWEERYRTGHYLHEAAGQPSNLDAKARSDIKSDLKRRRLEKKPPDEKEMAKLFHDGVAATGSRQNRVIPDPSASSIQKYKEEMGISRNTPQVASNARYIAGNDIRMSWTMWIMMKSLTENITFSQPLWNWDATQFVVSLSDKVRKVYTIKVEDTKIKSAPLSVVGNETLVIGIKWMHMGSATGPAIPLVLLIAVDGLTDPNCFVYPIAGMTSCVQGNSVGYLCFCPTRVGNDKFFTWFIQHVAIPAISDAQDLCRQSLGVEGPPLHAFVTCDGEVMVVEEVFNLDTRNMLASRNIDFGKISASCSGIHQPSDVSPLF